MTQQERMLLEWLAKDDAQYGECHGATLDSLLAKGFAHLHKNGERQSGFIAQGDSLMHCAVSITDAGLAMLAKPRAPEEPGR